MSCSHEPKALVCHLMAPIVAPYITPLSGVQTTAQIACQVPGCGWHTVGQRQPEGMVEERPEWSLRANIWVAVKELKLRDYPPIMENQMEKKMENEMETGGI